MARSRNIKPGFFLNEDLPEIGALAHLLFAGLWCIADREGRLEDRPRRIKAECLPHYDADVDSLLQKLSEGKNPFIIRYEANGSRYIQICNWHRHQSPHHTEKASEIPSIPKKSRASRCKDGGKTSEQPAAPESGIRNQESVVRNQESGISLEGGARGGNKKFVRPTVDQVAAYCRERKNHVDAQQFVDFYTGKGWKVGKNAMVDWQATVRTWEKNGLSVRAGPPNDPRNVKSSINEFLLRGSGNGES